MESRGLRGRLLVLLLAVLATVAPSRAAAAAAVWIVLSQERGAYGEVADTVKSALAQKRGAPALEIMTLAEATTRAGEDRAGRKPDLIVTVGAQAARQIATLYPRAPLLHTLIPRLAFTELAHGQAAVRHRSAIFLDQPVDRQLDLVRVALPRHKRVAVVLGPSSRQQLGELRAAARERSLSLSVETISEEGELIGALNRLLDDSDVLLSVADPVAFSGTTIHHLLLTTYRYKVPVVGLSKSYVGAGALMAVYSTPEQIGRQIAGVLDQMAANGWALPAPQYPKYFAVAVNERVAASLGIILDEEEAILHRLMAVGRGESADSL